MLIAYVSLLGSHPALQQTRKSWSDPCLSPICSRRLLLSSSAHNSNGPYVFPHVGIKRVCARPIIRYTRKTTSWGPGVFMRGAVQTCGDGLKGWLQPDPDWHFLSLHRNCSIMPLYISGLTINYVGLVFNLCPLMLRARFQRDLLSARPRLMIMTSSLCALAAAAPFIGRASIKRKSKPPADTILVAHTPPDWIIQTQSSELQRALLLAGAFYGALSMCATDWVMDWLLNRPLWAISGPNRFWMG